MARSSTDAAKMFQTAYGKSKDFLGTVKDESRAMYEDARRWMPEHRTAVAVSASAAVCVGVLGYAIGRRRADRAADDHGAVAAAIERAP